MIRLAVAHCVQLSANVPPSSLYGATKFMVPVNCDPLLQAAVTVATTAPSGSVDGTEAAYGDTVNVSVGGGAAVTVKLTFPDAVPPFSEAWTVNGPIDPSSAGDRLRASSNFAPEMTAVPDGFAVRLAFQ